MSLFSPKRGCIDSSCDPISLKVLGIGNVRESIKNFDQTESCVSRTDTAFGVKDVSEKVCQPHPVIPSSTIDQFGPLSV